MPVRTKSIYDEASRDDGLRILVTRYWPRGVSRQRVNEYISALAPSRELLRDFKDGAVKWTDFRRRYVTEMKNDRARAEIERLSCLALSEVVTLMCTCRDNRHCHRSLLLRLLSSARASSRRRR